jgi:hypothetical protein
MFQAGFVEKINICVIFDNIFPKIVPCLRYLKKCDGAVQAADDNMIGCMHFACWITEATNTHSEYAILTAFSMATVVT